MESLDIEDLEENIDEINKTLEILIKVLEPIFAMFIDFFNSLPELIQKYIKEEMNDE